MRKEFYFIKEFIEINTNIYDIIENTYLISKNGIVKNKNTNQILKASKTKDGYLTVSLKSKDGINKRRSLHRLVLASFNPHINMRNLQVNHINGNKKDNNLNNLEWCTCKENILHNHSLGIIKKGNLHHNAKISEKLVIKICDLLEKGYTPKMVCYELNLEWDKYKMIVQDIHQGKNWKHISNNYNFINKKLKKGYVRQQFKASKYDYDNIKTICKLLIESDLSISEISQKIFGNKNKNNINLISDIKNNRRYRIVSKLFW